MRRATTMAFAPRMHVFPGGRVDSRDYEIDVTFVGTDSEPQRLARRASAHESDMRALYACAVRETQEETGVVLAMVEADGGIVIDAAVMPIADHWVTPEFESHRYDVRFFVALLPTGQDAQLTTTEADHAEWISAAAAVEKFGAGDMAMLPPTITMVRYLAGFGDCAAMLSDAGMRTVVPLLPVRTTHDDGTATWALVHDTQGRP